MSNLEIAIITKAPLISKGLAYYCYSIFPDAVIASFSEFGKFKSGDLQPDIIFLDPLLLDEPRVVSMEKFYTDYSKSKIIGICRERLQEPLIPYFSSIIRHDASETEILSLLEGYSASFDGKKPLTETRELISDREKEVLRGVALGMTNREISDVLHISTHTVIAHRKNITAKLGIKTIAGLAVYAVLNGIISPDEMEEH